MRYILTFFGIIILLIVGYFILSTPTVKSLSSCLNEYHLKMTNNIAIAGQERWNKEKVCMASKPTLEEFRLCYSLVESKSIFPIDLVFQVTKMIKPGTSGGDVKEITKLHNSSCLDYPDAQIK